MKWVGSHFKQYFILLALQADDSRCAEGAECLTPEKNEGDASMQTVLCGQINRTGAAHYRRPPEFRAAVRNF